jgi:hypothetical protein
MRRDRTDSNASQKRKFADNEGCDEDEYYNRSKVSKMDEKEEEEFVILESKISKVSTVCGKLYTMVQQSQLDVEDPLRNLLAELIDAVKVTNEVQGELSTK